MSVAEADPRFRDQIAKALRDAAHVCGWDVPCPCVDWPDEQYDAAVHATAVSARHVNEVQGVPEAFADALMPTIAAEVEARVQAAANQRAAVLAVANAMAAQPTKGNDGIVLGGFADRLRAALASPAPAPRAEEGQETALERQRRVASQRLSQIPKAYR